MSGQPISPRVAAFMAAYPLPERDVVKGRELAISEEEIAWAREKMAGEHHSDAGFSSINVAGCVRMLMRNDLHHEMICTMGRDRIARLVLEVDRLRKLVGEGR